MITENGSDYIFFFPDYIFIQPLDVLQFVFFFNGGMNDTKHDIVSVIQHNDSIFVHIMKQRAQGVWLTSLTIQSFRICFFR